MKRITLLLMLLALPVSAAHAVGFIVQPLPGTNFPIDAVEGQSSWMFSIRMDSAPTHPVFVSFNLQGTDEVTTNWGYINFQTDPGSPQYWNRDVTIMVTGILDNIPDGNQAFTIVTQPAISVDPAWNGVNADDVPGICHDIDTAPLVFQWQNTTAAIEGPSTATMWAFSDPIGTGFDSVEVVFRFQPSLIQINSVTPGDHGGTWAFNVGGDLLSLTGDYSGGVTGGKSLFSLNYTPIATDTVATIKNAVAMLENYRVWRNGVPVDVKDQAVYQYEAQLGAVAGMRLLTADWVPGTVSPRSDLDPVDRLNTQPFQVLVWAKPKVARFVSASVTLQYEPSKLTLVQQDAGCGMFGCWLDCPTDERPEPLCGEPVMGNQSNGADSASHFAISFGYGGNCANWAGFDKGSEVEALRIRFQPAAGYEGPTNIIIRSGALLSTNCDGTSGAVEYRALDVDTLTVHLGGTGEIESPVVGVEPKVEQTMFTVAEARERTDLYDLSGRRVKADRPGVYFMRGASGVTRRTVVVR